MADHFFVYILRSQRDGAIYIGQTGNLRRRLSQHNTPSSKSYTAKRGPWDLVHIERHPDRSTAMQRERFLKSCAGAHEKRLLAEGEVIDASMI